MNSMPAWTACGGYLGLGAVALVNVVLAGSPTVRALWLLDVVVAAVAGSREYQRRMRTLERDRYRQMDS